ncbi:MAG: DUF1489 domain-containing protein [Hyphomicrobiaceae bacterium]|nr:DUF1489 domain-containing protein [Hyphomicrobiaceae bacterium]
MALHLVKLCVGATSIDDLASWQEERLAAAHRAGERPARLVHTTFQTPKRGAELMDGGSLYWVIKGLILARQRILGLDEGVKETGEACCLIVLDPALVAVRPAPRRAFQGWRYLTPDDAPADLPAGAAPEADGLAAMPPAMRRELAALGLL